MTEIRGIAALNWREQANPRFQNFPPSKRVLAFDRSLKKGCRTQRTHLQIVLLFNRGQAMQTFFRDIHYAARKLRRSPAFTATVVMTLALGIGATAAIFSCVYALLLKSLPFADAGRIVALSENHPQIPGGIEATYPDYEDWKAQQHSFTQIAAYSTLNPETVSMVADGRAQQVRRVLASGNLFSLLGINPTIGRVIGGATRCSHHH